MTLPRTLRKAKNEIIKNVGTQFDSEIVKLFEENFDKIQMVYEKYDEVA